MLEGHSVDSLSLTIAIDHALPREFSLPAQSRIQWRAEKSFTLSIGNPAALELTLNGIRLTSISKSNKPVKNLMLSRSTIEKLQTRPD
jgi:hypothetical protein